MLKINKEQFRLKVRQLKNLGITQARIAKRIGYSVSQIQRALNKNWKGDCSKVYNAFGRVFK